VDVFSELLFGARIALQISAVVVLVSAVIGVAIGTLAGYLRGWVDEVIMRVIDVLLAFPGILLNLAIVAVVKRPSVGIVIFALCINGWVGYARVARGQVLSLREREYVTAARSVGAGPLRVMALHVVPNLLSPLIVQMTFGFGGVIAVESTLSFLGLGPPFNYSWGALLDQGRELLTMTQRIVLVPGLAIAWVILASNLLGDGLRDRLDPRRIR
jgi:peptide/nickel transport system permease protein